MKKLLAALALIVVPALSAPAYAAAIFDDGPTDGTARAFYIDGPSGGVAQLTIYDTFTATGSGTAGELDLGIWVGGGTTPSSITWALGTSYDDSSIGGETVSLTAANYTYLFTNGFGFDVYEVVLTGLTSAMLTAGNSYVLTLTGNSSDGNGQIAWDLPNAGVGGPAACGFAQDGEDEGDCRAGGQAFTLLAAEAVPEPSTLALLGAGLVVAGAFSRRRKAKT